MAVDIKLKSINLNDVLFIDVETVPEQQNFSDLSENFQKHWEKKSNYFRKENETAEDVYQRAGIYAEFGKIICISVGFIITIESTKKLRVKSFFNHNEKELLKDFSAMLCSWDKSNNKILCGHNIKEFDVPYISRRMLVNNIELPDTIDNAGKKPWEVKHIDTMELWKFGDYKNYTSLAVLADLFKIPTPKDDLDGSKVAEVYYKDNDLERIVSYCEKDVLAVANLFLKFRNEDIILYDNLEKV